MMRRAANLCMAVGAAVAVLGVIGFTLGFRPSALPSALLDIAVFKLVFIAAGGLVVAGAVLGRSARREADRHNSQAAPDRVPENLQAGAPDLASRSPAQEPERVRREP